MIGKRIIPCLDVRDGRVVKGVNFQNVQDVEDPVAMAAFYNDELADELVFYDITASHEGRALFTDVLRRVASSVFIPLTVGGGIRTLDDFDRVLKAGADKVSVNSGAIADPSLIGAAAKRYGDQCVVLSMDVARVKAGADAAGAGAAGAGAAGAGAADVCASTREPGQSPFRLYAKGGRVDTGIDALQWAIEGVAAGAGEIVLNSIDTDGVRQGFDLEMLAAFAEVVDVPIIASGGAGCKEDFLKLFDTVPGVDAGLAASIFHFRDVRIADLKRYLADNGVPVRLK